MITRMKSARPRRRDRRGAALLAIAVLPLAMAGCSSAGASSPAAMPTASNALVSAQKTSLGTILVNSKGRTLYVFANDRAGVSTCTGACSANWPALAAPTALPASLSGVTGRLGATTTGTRQLTVAGHPLYTFVGDSAAGQTNGQGITLNGGLWTVVSPAGAPVKKPAASGTGTGPAY